MVLEMCGMFIKNEKNNETNNKTTKHMTPKMTQNNTTQHYHTHTHIHSAVALTTWLRTFPYQHTSESAVSPAKSSPRTPCSHTWLSTYRGMP